MDSSPTPGPAREKPDPLAGVEPISGWLIGIFVVVLFAGGIYFGRYSGTFAGDNLDPFPTEQSAELSQARVKTPPGETSPAAGEVSVILIQNMKFNPPGIEVEKGATVEWRNTDITAHSATSGLFDSGAIDSDKSWRHTFTENGSFPYACTFHPEMRGTVNVKK